MRKQKNEKAITIIALVITIIILLIITGVTIGTVMSNNGIIKRLGNTSSQFESSKQNLSNSVDTLYDKLSGGVTNLTSTVIRIIPSTTEYTNQDVDITISKIATDYSIEYSFDKENWQTYTKDFLLNKNTQIFARLVKNNGTEDKETGNVATYQVTNIDKLLPDQTAPETVSSTSEISVTNKQKDADNDGDNAKSGIKKIEYGIKNEDEEYEWQDDNKFNDLNNNTEYYIKTRVTDWAGNQSESEEAIAATATIPNDVQIQVSNNTNWTKDKTVTIISPNVAYKKQYKIDNGAWQYYNGEFKIYKNETITARLTDGTNSSIGTVPFVVDKIDGQAPTKDKPTVASYTSNSITINNNQKDNLGSTVNGSGNSGIDASITQYGIKKLSESSYKWIQTGNSSYTFENLTQGSVYNIVTKVTDYAENESISEVTNITTELLTPDIQYSSTPTSYTGGNVTVIASTKKSYSIQLSEGNTNNYSTRNIIVVGQNETIYGRLIDSTGQTSAYSTIKISNIYKNIALYINPNGGSYNGNTNNTSVIQNYGMTYNVSTPTRAGYTFTGWSKSGQGSLNGNTYTFGTSTGYLTANWIVSGWLIAFNANGGIASSSSMIVKRGSSYGNLPTASKSDSDAHYDDVFNGWYTSPSGGTRVDNNTVPTSNCTLYAQYTQVSMCMEQLEPDIIFNNDERDALVSHYAITGSDDITIRVNGSKPYIMTGSNLTKKTEYNTLSAYLDTLYAYDAKENYYDYCGMNITRGMSYNVTFSSAVTSTNSVKILLKARDPEVNTFRKKDYCDILTLHDTTWTCIWNSTQGNTYGSFNAYTHLKLYYTVKDARMRAEDFNYSSGEFDNIFKGKGYKVQYYDGTNWVSLGSYDSLNFDYEYDPDNYTKYCHYGEAYLVSGDAKQYTQNGTIKNWHGENYDYSKGDNKMHSVSAHTSFRIYK